MGNAKYHHLIPQTYMKSWCFQNNSIWTYDKETSKLEQRNISNILGENYYHSIKAGSLVQTDDSLNYIFTPLDGYFVHFEGRPIQTKSELNNLFHRFDEWDIFDSAGMSLPKRRKNELKARISSKNYNKIEEEWSQQMENSWSSFISEIDTKLDDIRNGEEVSLTTDSTDTLLKYIVMYNWRSPVGNIQFNEAYRMLTKLVPEIFDIEIPEEDRVHSDEKTVASEIRHNYLLKKYAEFLEGKGTIYNIYEQYRKIFTFAFLINDNRNFITSDNPVIEFINKDGYREITFAALPNLLVTLCKKDPEEPTAYKIAKIFSDDVEYYNSKFFEYGNLILSSVC